MVSEIRYYVYKIFEEVIHKFQDQIDAILNVPRPVTITQVTVFIVLVVYYS